MRILDRSKAVEAAEETISNFEYEGQLTAEEIIPGLVEAIKMLAQSTSNPSQAIDEALEQLTEEE